MNELFRTLKIANNITVSSFANWFIYYLKRIPLIGRLFKNITYLELESKKDLAWIIIILSMIKKIFGIAICASILILAPMFIVMPDLSNGLGDEYLHRSFLHIYFFVYIILNNIINCYTLESKRMKFICVKLMRMNARDYNISTYFLDRMWGFIASLPTFIGLSLLYNGTIYQGFILCIIAKLCSFFGEGLNLWYYSKKRKILQKNYIFTLGFISVFLAAAYLPVIFKKIIYLESFLFHPIVIILLVFVGLLSISYLLKYPFYKECIDEANRIENIAAINVQQVTKDSRFADVKLKEKQYTKDDLITVKFNDKNGYDYLNALFFHRLKNQLIKPVIHRIALITLIFIGGIVVTYINKGNLEFTPFVLEYYPGLIFIMYILSTVVEKSTRAMFYNCDISLLHYGFYKKDNSLLKMFWLRLNYLTGLNIVPAIVLSLSICIIGYLNNPTMMGELLPVGIFILVLSIFFTIHHLFLYYIFQPFTTELNMKSPVYSIINTITYIFCWGSLQVQAAPMSFMMIVMIITIIYVIIALILVLKLASRTFNIR